MRKWITDTTTQVRIAATHAASSCSAVQRYDADVIQ